VVSSILDVNNVESTQVSFSVVDDTDSANVVTSGNQAHIADIELAVVFHNTGFEVDLHGIVDVDVWVWESDGSSIVGDDVWDSVWTDFLSNDLADLEVGFSFLQGLQHESSLDVVEESVVLFTLFEVEDVHQTDWELWISSELVVDTDGTFLILGDEGGFSAGESDLQSVSQEDVDWNGFVQFVWTLHGSWGPATSHLGEHP